MRAQYIVKREYKTPFIVRINLDNEISLVLESNPPEGPEEVTSNATEYFNNDPFKASFT